MRTASRRVQRATEERASALAALASCLDGLRELEMTSDDLALLGALRATLPTPDDAAFTQACASAAPRHDWSRLHPRCVGCQTVDQPHYARGRCHRCYERRVCQNPEGSAQGSP